MKIDGPRISRHPPRLGHYFQRILRPATAAAWNLELKLIKGLELCNYKCSLCVLYSSLTGIDWRDVNSKSPFFHQKRENEAAPFFTPFIPQKKNENFSSSILESWRPREEEKSYTPRPLRKGREKAHNKREVSPLLLFTPFSPRMRLPINLMQIRSSMTCYARYIICNEVKLRG